MGKKDTRVDAYIAKSADFAQPILAHLRRLVHAACPAVEETIKWGFPHFMHQGMLCHMAAFKKHCAFGFWHKAMCETLAAGKPREAMGQLGRITALADLPGDAVLKRFVKEAVQLNAAGVKSPVVRSAAKKLTIPAYFLKALRQNKPAHANFKKMSPSHQREYVEWITEARQDQTRARRLATMLEWLAEGKSRNWKYER